MWVCLLCIVKSFLQIFTRKGLTSLLIFEEYGLCQCMLYRGLIFMHNHLCIFFGISLHPQAHIFGSYKSQKCGQVVTFFTNCVVKEVILLFRRKIATPKCSKTALSISFFKFGLKFIARSFHITRLLKIASAVFKIFKTAIDGNSKPPFCLKQVNFA